MINSKDVMKLYCMCSFLCYRIPGLRHAFRKLISDLPKVLRIKFIARRNMVFVRWVSRKAREFASGGPTVYLNTKCIQLLVRYESYID